MPNGSEDCSSSEGVKARLRPREEVEGVEEPEATSREVSGQWQLEAGWSSGAA